MDSSPNLSVSNDEDDDYNFDNIEDQFSGGWNFMNDNYSTGQTSEHGQYNTGERLSNERRKIATSSNHEMRPMTAVSSAGYNSNLKGDGSTMRYSNSNGFTLNSKNRSTSSSSSEKTPEQQIKQMEIEISQLIKTSSQHIRVGDKPLGLDIAKEASKKDRILVEFKERHKIKDEGTPNLSYAISIHLAKAYETNSMITEALDAYSLIIKQKCFTSSGGRTRVNMGNLYFRQKNYLQAVKMYRMALDQIPRSRKILKHKIYRNIGNAFIKIGDMKNAIQSYESALLFGGGLETEFNLLLCFVQLGNVDKSKRLLMVIASDPALVSANDEKNVQQKNKMKSNESSSDLDKYAIYRSKRIKEGDFIIFTAARLVASMTWGDDWREGYSWVQEQLKRKHEKTSLLIKMEECVQHLKKKNFNQALAILKSFEKKEKDVMTMAANNLSFMYLLEGNIDQAEEMAELALSSNRYNPCALVNKGNVLYNKTEFDKARDMYLEAIGVSSGCVEAIYNLGLTNIKIGALDEARNAFAKLNSLTKNDPCALYQIANIYQLQGNHSETIKWLNVLNTCVPTDPSVSARLGNLFSTCNDDAQSFHHYMESYRIYPSNLDVISWLGVWFVKNEMYEKSVLFFERAAEIQPKEAKWKLMVASCYRRMDDYDEALSIYKYVHHAHPENSECLRYLIALCKDIDEPYEKYQKALYSIVGTEIPTIQNDATNHNNSKVNLRLQSKLSRKGFGIMKTEESATSNDFEEVDKNNAKVNIGQEKAYKNSHFPPLSDEREDATNYDLSELLV